MSTLRIRYLVTKPAKRPGGLPRYYWQPTPRLRAAGWQIMRIPADHDSHIDPDQLQAAAIAAAQARTAEAEADLARTATKAAQPVLDKRMRNLGDLICAYRASKSFTAKADKTRKVYEQCLKKLEVWGADSPLRAISPVQVQRLLEGLSNTPAFANATVRTLRLVMSFGVRDGWLSINPAVKPALADVSERSVLWPDAAITAFVEKADEMGYHSVGTAVILNSWLGQRQADVLRMPRVALRKECLLIRQGKTGAAVELPIGQVPHLWQRLQAELARQDQRVKDTPGGVVMNKHKKRKLVSARTIIANDVDNQPYRQDWFAHLFMRVRAELAMDRETFDVDQLLPGRDTTDEDAFSINTMDLTFMALRHTAVTKLAEAGCDIGLISSITGHKKASLAQIMDRYMISTSKMAGLAFKMRMEAER